MVSQAIPDPRRDMLCASWRKAADLVMAATSASPRASPRYSGDHPTRASFENARALSINPARTAFSHYSGL
jgi:hypothetical protein